MIQSSYWRLQALVRLAPLYDRFGLSRHRLNREIRELAAHVGTSARIVAPDRRTPSERFIALADEIWEAGDASRLPEAQSAFARLTEHHRPIGAAHLARLELRFRSVDAALARVRGIREQGRRSGALLVVVRGAVALGRLELAREIADMISAAMMRERALLAIAEQLVARGQGRHAMKMLSRIAMPGLQAERFWLYALIRHRGPHPQIRHWRFFPDAMMRASVEEPAWVRVGEARPPVATRVELMRAAFFVGLRRRFLDEDCFPTDAARIVSRYAVTPAARRELVELLRTDPDVIEAIETLGRFGTKHLAEALLVEYVGRCARELLGAEAPAALCDGLTGRTASSNDPRSIERALYDEGIALSRESRQRRRVLIAIAQHCIRSALTAPATWTAPVIDARLRTLAHLEGELARDALAKPLATLPLPSAFALPVIETLARLDARTAASIVLGRAEELRAGGTDVDRALVVIEAHRGVPVGFADAYAAAARRVGDRFLGELSGLWRRRNGGAVPPLVLRSLSRREVAPATPQDMLDELAGTVESFGEQGHVEIVERVASERGLLEQLLVASPARVHDRIRGWDLMRWRMHLYSAKSVYSGSIDEPLVRRCARRIGCSPALLASGDLVALGAAPVRWLRVAGEDYCVRLLDKRRDLLTYLRFADVPVRTCYRSDLSMWKSETQAHTVAAWKDPLTFCFHIERRVADAYVPIGFSFGGFVDLEGGLGVALNGLYMKNNGAELRFGVIDAIERTFDRIGIARIGITARYQSRGPLPTRYVRTSVALTRLRALERDGRLLSDSFDDVQRDYNEPTTVSHLYWRRRRE
ncbi:MAG: hypothetical protein HOV81_44255 [Kofleriaceae bacterium]|nr:hypothetical protein [Kofleriaceae bacterium]